MPVNKDQYKAIQNALIPHRATLVAVSKIKPAADIMALYNLGQRDFGENYVQEMVEKEAILPKDIRWHFIGHLQSNKVKYIAPFVYLIHGVDNHKLLKEINKQAAKHRRTVQCLLQVHIAQEETKFGLSHQELQALINEVAATGDGLQHICLKGLMGMASNTDDKEKIRQEFRELNQLYQQYAAAQTNNIQFSTLSMGMSGDWEIALQEGSNMVRIGSLLFGARL